MSDDTLCILCSRRYDTVDDMKFHMQAKHRGTIAQQEIAPLTDKEQNP